MKDNRKYEKMARKIKENRLLSVIVFIFYFGSGDLFVIRARNGDEQLKSIFLQTGKSALFL